MFQKYWPLRAKSHGFLLYLLLSGMALAHMEMSQPFPINSNLNPQVPYDQKDYSYTSPLASDGSNFPCKGYQNQRPIIRTASYRQGGTYNMSFAGTATHDGGSCQISLSYDNGKTFRVIKSMIGGCPLQPTYKFTIPHYAPLGSPLLAWSWMNEIGNREYYMNCAWVEIKAAAARNPLSDPRSGQPRKKSGNGNRNDSHHDSVQEHHDRQAPAAPGRARGRRSIASNKRGRASTHRVTYDSFDQLPFIWKANLPPENECVTVEGEDVVFTNPGPDVEYANGYSASSSKSPNNGCDTPGPPGPAYRDMQIGPFGSFPQSGGSSAIVSSSSGPFPLTSTISFPSSQTISTSSARSKTQHNATPINTYTTLSTKVSSDTASVPSPTLPDYPSPTIPGQPYPNTAAPIPADEQCDSGIPGLGFKCLRSGHGFAVCDQHAWVDMGQTSYGTKCVGLPGQAVIVPYNWTP